MPKDNVIQVKIVLLGDGAVGKTTFKLRYLGRGFREKYMPTLGADISIIEITVNNQPLKCRIWDLAGQPKFKAVRQQYYRGSVGAILMYDVSRPDSLSNLRTWVTQLEQHNPIENIPIIVVGNKIDLREESKDTLLSKEQGLEFVESLKDTLGNGRPIHFFESSAKYNFNTKEVFNKLGYEVLKFVESLRDNLKSTANDVL